MGLRSIFERSGGRSGYDVQIDTQLLVEQRERNYAYELRVAASELRLYEQAPPDFPEPRHDIIAGEAVEQFLLDYSPQTLEGQFVHIYETQQELARQAEDLVDQEPVLWRVADFSENDHRVELLSVGKRIGELLFDRGPGEHKDITLRIDGRDEREIDAMVDPYFADPRYTDYQAFDMVIRYAEAHAEKAYDVSSGAALLRYALKSCVSVEDLREEYKR